MNLFDMNHARMLGLLFALLALCIPISCKPPLINAVNQNAENPNINLGTPPFFSKYIDSHGITWAQIFIFIIIVLGLYVGLDYLRFYKKPILVACNRIIAWSVPKVRTLIIWGLMIFFVVKITNWFSNISNSRYEGQTAEEWFNEYDSLSSCIEDRAGSWEIYDSEELAEYVKGCL